MPAATGLGFGPFQLAGASGPLRRDGVELKLQPKTLTLLWTLARQPGEVVTKAALFDAVWPRRLVAEGALSFQMQCLREALGDDPKAPRYIATVHRVGFRFIAPVLDAASTPLASTPEPVPAALVGRSAEIEQLWKMFSHALAGQRQIVFVTGEAGIGKTALVDSFVARAQAARQGLRAPRGQCVEQYGEAEAFLPFLEVLERLCRRADGAEIIELLKNVAPAWLSQLSSVLSGAEREVLQARAAGVTRERTMRQLAEVLDLLCARQPLLIVLEDLHWSDSSSIELLAMLAQRREPARLMLLCTFRPVDAIVAQHPVNATKQALISRRLCEELGLRNLTAADVAEYLAQRFGALPDNDGFTAAVHRRTEGLPLFVVQIADDVAHQPPDQVADKTWHQIESRLPQRLQELVEMQVARLTPAEQGLLEVAATAGSEFAASTIAAALDAPVAAVEIQCERLARQALFLEDRGLTIWPDGTVCGRYGFRHTLYQNVLYRRLSAGRRSHLHLQIAVRMENGFGERAREIAAELAMHFTHAQDLHRAARYHQQAGVSALQRSAPQQAFEHLRRALELLLSTPDTAQRRQQELSLQSDLGVSIIAGQGYTAPEVGQAFARALQLCEALGDDAPLPSILWGLFLFRLIRAEFDSALGYGEKLLELAQTHSDPGLSLQARLALGAVLLFRGEFPAAQMHFDEGLDLCDLAPPNFAAVLHTQNLRVECTATAAWLLWMRGYPDQARQRAAQALSLAREAQSPNSLAVALYRQAVLHQLLGYGELAYTGATELLRHSREHGLPHWEMAAIVLLGAEEVAQKADASAIPRMQKAIAARNSMGVGLGATLDLALLADAHRRLGQSEAGLQIVAEARSLIDAKGERLHESWLHLIEGELWVCGSVPQTDKAESCFRRAIEVAGRQGARSWALRAASGLGRLCKRTGRMQEARTAIASVYQEFTEGFDTGDLRQARSLLDE